MNLSFAAVLIIMVLLIGFVVLILRSLAASAGVRIRQDMRRMLSAYDALLEEKGKALKALQDEQAAVEAALEKLDASSMEKQAPAEDVPVEQAIGAATVPSAAAYRAAGASKAIPGFDVIDYGQEDYVFGSGTKDARHWSKYVLKVFEEHEDTLSSLFYYG